MQVLGLLASLMMERQRRSSHLSFQAHARISPQSEALKQLHQRLRGWEALVDSAITSRGLGIKSSPWNITWIPKSAGQLGLTTVSILTFPAVAFPTSQHIV
jgi:hypothetical protein